MNRRKFLKFGPVFFLSSLLARCAVQREKPCPLYDSESGWIAALPEKNNFKNNPAFTFVKNNPALPRILLIGDSISIGYTPFVRELLAEKANVHRIPENGGDTGKGLQKLDFWLGKRKWDVIHFNWGLHDLKYFKNNKLDVSGTQIRSVENYSENLKKLVLRLKKTSANLIWATTTPIPEGSNGRIAGDEIRYNAAAGKIMQNQKISVNDLHQTVLQFPDKYQRPQNVHFTPEGSKFLADKVAREILTFI